MHDWSHAIRMRAGWTLTAERVVENPEDLDFAALFDRLEAERLNAAPEVQWTMNSVLAEIGIHAPKLRKRALSHRSYLD